MSETLSTINQLALEEGKDPRSVELTLTRNGVRPVARLHSEKRPQPLYSRDEAKKDPRRSAPSNVSKAVLTIQHLTNEIENGTRIRSVPNQDVPH
jgi:hypothetical protein